MLEMNRFPQTPGVVKHPMPGMGSKGETSMQSQDVFRRRDIARALSLAAALLVLAGCARQEAPEPVVEEAPAAPVRAVMDQTEVGEIPAADNPAQQEAFTELYRDIRGVFNSPTPNQNFYLTRKEGDPVFGRLVGLSPNEVTVIDDDNQEVVIPRDALSEESAESLYADTFAEALTRQAGRMNEMDLDALLKDDPDTPSRPRLLITDAPVLRYGPGQHFTVVDQEETFLRGSVVHVLRETNDWLLVSRSASAEYGEGWMQKSLTFPVDPSNLDILEAEVEALKASGRLISIDLDRNEAVVDRYLWTLDNPAVQEGRSRLLAYYVGNKKESRRWVDIIENQTGRRLAQYSEAKGLRVF